MIQYQEAPKRSECLTYCVPNYTMAMLRFSLS